MPPGRKEWFEDPSDNYVIGPGGFDGEKSDKTNEEILNNWSNPLHLSDYVPGTRIPKREWKGKKFWERKPIPPYNINRFVFPTSEGRCPLCGEFLLEKRSKYGNFYGCSAFPKCHYKCTEKQYHAIIPDIDPEEFCKSLVQPIEIGVTMKASEARTLAENADSLMNVVSSIRKTIDKHIKDVADMGELETTISLSENGKFPLKRVSERVVELLKLDGYEASCRCSYDPREREDIATYYIKW